MEIIRKYLIEERKMPVVVAERTLEKLARHPDISDELKSWIANRTYETNTLFPSKAIPEPILQDSHHSWMGLEYSHFGFAEEQPEKAKEQITMGFPRK